MHVAVTINRLPGGTTHEAGQIGNSAALQIIDLLDGKNNHYDISIYGDECTISASSFNEKGLLKSSGFCWSSKMKRWACKVQLSIDVTYY